ncbi:MAG TPA: hypothetical protein VMG12_00995, partial [Polyangiaceae bacterium]|nr:hypothetical protein [Polyangiaceae bacterium]
DAPVSCADGGTATLVTPSNGMCDVPYLDDCAATAGDMRRCAEATRRDPCAAAQLTPPECAPLYASACDPLLTASPVLKECPRLDAQQLAVLDGVYEIVSHTRSESACEAGDDSVRELDTQPFVVVVSTEGFSGQPIALLESCSELETCREAAARFREIPALPSQGDVRLGYAPAFELGLVFDCPDVDPATYVARERSMPSSSDDCRRFDTKTVLSRGADGALRLDSETRESSRDTDPGACAPVQEYRRTTAAECTSADSREARFVEAL